MILDVFQDIFQQAHLHVLIKSAMLSMSFPDGVSVCQGIPKFFPLQIEDSSNGPGENSSVARTDIERRFRACEIGYAQMYRQELNLRWRRRMNIAG
jgi:hypothetical protein